MGRQPAADTKIALLSRRNFLTTIATGALAQLTWQHRLTPMTRPSEWTASRPDTAGLGVGPNRTAGPYWCPQNGSGEAPQVLELRYSELLRDFPKATNYIDHVEAHAREEGLDPLLVMAVIRQESLFGHFVVSDIGAVGVMQIIPPTARYLGMKTLIYPSDYDKLLLNFLHGSGRARKSASGKLKSYAKTLRRGYKESQGAMKALDERFDTEKNIQAGCRYLAMLEKRLGSIDLALAGYYAGPTAIRRRGLSSPVRRYVAQVKDFYQNYQQTEAIG